jgi:hypothetical protein
LCSRWTMMKHSYGGEKLLVSSESYSGASPKRILESCTARGHQPHRSWVGDAVGCLPANEPSQLKLEWCRCVLYPVWEVSKNIIEAVGRRCVSSGSCYEAWNLMIRCCWFPSTQEQGMRLYIACYLLTAKKVRWDCIWVGGSNTSRKNQIWLNLKHISKIQK